MALIYGSGFELYSIDDKALAGEVVALCAHPDCVKTATEWEGEAGYCSEHAPVVKQDYE